MKRAKTALKALGYAIAPRWTTALLSARSRALLHRMVARWGFVAINQKLIANLGPAVQEGPFAGLLMSPMTTSEHLGPFLLGVYESELDPAWELVLQGSYVQILDIGAKFGYYAVGLARHFPLAHVVAFDTDWWARKALVEMAKMNNVRNVEVSGYCDAAWLRRHAKEGALVFCDCEGYEGQLLCNGPIPQLSSSTLIIETHEFLVPGVTQKLREQFAPTHSIRVFKSLEKRRTSTRNLAFLSEQERTSANQEIRLPQEWLLCIPK